MFIRNERLKLSDVGKVLLVCVLLLLAVGAAVASATTTYTYTELLPPGWQRAVAVAINNNGTVVGNGLTNDDKGSLYYDKGFIYSGGIYTELIPPGPGWTHSFVSSINDSGVVVGYGNGPGFIYNGGIYTTFLFPNWGSLTPLAINNNGLIAGVGYDSYFGEYKIFIYSEGTYKEFRLLGWGVPTAIGINDSGVVLGWACYIGCNGFTYDGGELNWMPSSGWIEEKPTGINNNNVVVGYGTDSSGAIKGYIYSAGAYQLLLPPSWRSAAALGINDNGVVVGGGVNGERVSKGFVYDGTTYTELLPAGWKSASAKSINNGGVIVGSGVDSSGIEKLFIAMPVVNSAPIANAGPEQTVRVGSRVTLDGSGSSDPDGNVPLTYSWRFLFMPNGSSASLSNPAAVNPTFTADHAGNYLVQLIVTDSLGTASQAAMVMISTTNTAPVADAGPDQAVTMLGSTIQLNGSKSYDPDGDAITYQWSLVSVPSGSTATLSNPDIASPTFIADRHGTYVAQLVVRDPWTQGAPAKVTVSFENVKPVANAGMSRSGIVGDTISINGNGSSDANGDPLTYQWSFASVPSGSQAVIASPASVTTTFVPDLAGTYVVQLIVNDGFVNSDPATIQVQVVTAQTAAVEDTQNIQTIISKIDPAVLQNPNMQNALNNKLNAVIANISAGNYAAALDQLQNDILKKTDGCATTGAPDKNDWIKTCQEQAQVYPYVMQLIQLLKTM